MESDSYRTLFGDVIDKYMAFDLTPIKGPDFAHAANHSKKEFYQFLETWIGGTIKEKNSLKNALGKQHF